MIPTRRYAPLLLLVAAAACGPAARESGRAAPHPSGPSLPAIPRVEAPLAVDVVYPREGSAIPVRDSTFIFGNVGTGGATLTINGAAVPVEANGSFIAFLPVPPDGVYRLDAAKNGQTAHGERRVKVPTAETATVGGKAAIQGGSVSPRGAIALIEGERLDVSFRGTAGGRAFVVLPDGTRYPLVEERRGERTGREFVVEPEAAPQAAGGVSTYRGSIPAQAIRTADTSVARPRLGPGTTPETAAENQAAAAAAGAARTGAAGQAAAVATSDARVELVVAGDTLRAPLALNLAVISPTLPRVGVAADPKPVGGTNDGYVVGRPAPGTTSNWFWPNGTEFQITGERAGEYRVALGPNLSAWVQADEVRLLPEGTPPPTSMVGSVRLAPDSVAVAARINLSRKLPFEVDVDGRTLDIVLYGATSATDWLFYGPSDPLLDRASWTQVADGVYRLRVELTRPVWGYDADWAANGDLVVRIRRPPEIDPDRPLRGITVYVDPGHGPPEGRWGPTRYTESAANLGIAEHLGRLVEEAGGRAILSRHDTSAVGLYDRPRMAKEMGADLFVSIHNNALPDGVNPFRNSGTSTYYFHPQSAALAREMQREIVNEFGLKDLGAGRSSLAVVRWSAWFPAALSESMFFMIPDQEAALKDPKVQERLARAHVRALETFLRSMR